MQKLNLLALRLDLFDGAAAAGGDGGSQGAAPESASAAVQKGKKGESVAYGKQNPEGAAPPSAEAGKEPGVVTTSNTAEDRKKAYRDLMSGEYKDLYNEDIQRMTERRSRETKQLERQLGEYQPVIDLLRQRYGSDDVGQLAKALENDDKYWSEAAEEAGMSVEQYKKFQKLQRENADLLRQQRQRQGQERADAQMRRWYDEAEQAREKYPSFDLRAEAQDPNFLAMLKAGVPVLHAYEVAHMDDIKAGIAAMQAKATEKQVTENIRAKGARPPENGTAPQSGFTVRDDVHKLTKKDRAEIARRAAMGEKITF